MTTKEEAGRVYLVDDDRDVLDMLGEMLAPLDVDTRSFASARAFLQAYHPLPCECLVCDIRMPDIDGLEVQQRLRDARSAVPIIFLTGHAEVSLAVEAMKRGAFDFLQKPVGMEALLGRIRAALAFNREQYREWRAGKAIEARLALLTERERSVIHHVVAGRSSRETSELLGLSVRTVENHRMRILEKLHVSSTVELVKLFL